MTAPGRLAEATTARERTITVGIGELVVASGVDVRLVTHALGSCVAVCLSDPGSTVSGLLHFLLPDSRQSIERAAAQPSAFADRGIPLLFEKAREWGLHQGRARVCLVGGAEIVNSGVAALQIGRRNVLAARRILWQLGVLIHHEEIGGIAARSVYLSGDGTLQVKASGALLEISSVSSRRDYSR